MPDDSADDQLASLLDACLRAERRLPGSSARIVRGAPDRLRPELEQLLELGVRLRSLQGVTLPLVVSQGLRARIIQRISVVPAAAPAWPRLAFARVRRWAAWLLRRPRPGGVRKP